MGVFKAKLRYLWLREKRVVNRSAKDKRLASINRAIQAWAQITPEAVLSAFEKAIPRDMPVVLFEI